MFYILLSQVGLLTNWRRLGHQLKVVTGLETDTQALKQKPTRQMLRQYKYKTKVKHILQFLHHRGIRYLGTYEGLLPCLIYNLTYEDCLCTMAGLFKLSHTQFQKVLVMISQKCDIRNLTALTSGGIISHFLVVGWNSEKH